MDSTIRPLGTKILLLANVLQPEALPVCNTAAIAPAAMLFPLIRPALFALDPEHAHRLSIAALKALPQRLPRRPPAA